MCIYIHTHTHTHTYIYAYFLKNSIPNNIIHAHSCDVMSLMYVLLNTLY